MLTNWRSRKSQHGAAALEFALVVPILIVFVFGIVDFGLMINSQAVFANASRDAARAGSFGASQSEIQGVVTTETSHLPNIAGTPTTTVSCRKATGATCGANYNTEKQAGGVVVIRIVYVHQWLTPALLGLPSTSTITKTSEMRIE